MNKTSRNIVAGLIFGSLATELGCAQLAGIGETEVTAGAAGTPALGGSGGNPSSGAGGGGGTDSAGGGAGVANGGGAGTSAGGGGGAESAGGSGEPDAGSGVCAEGAERCGAEGHETCSGGVWTTDPCPIDRATCEGDTCINRGAALVAVGTSYYIDATEVTVSQYRAFLEAKNGDTSGQPSVCAFNTSYYEEDITLKLPNQPIADVDWCDAAAYCTWANKHLCGRIGGGSVAVADVANRTISQWFLACGGPDNAVQVAFNDGDCNSSMGFTDIADVATYPNCEGYYPGVFDLQGNVAEWIDSCDGATGNTDLCMLMGGNVIDQESYCDEVFDEYSRDTKAYTFGFRCCAG